MILKVYDFLKERPLFRWLTLLLSTIILALLILRLGYKEDISDFLPLGTSDRDALTIYQDISGAKRLFVLFENPGDEDKTVQAVDRFSELFTEQDTLKWIDDLTSSIDMEKIGEVTDFVYENIPYFLTERDYVRIDSLTATENFVEKRLAQDKEALLFPSGGTVAANICRDPLGLFSPVLKRLQRSNEQLSYEMYDGKIFTPQMKYAVVMMTTPFGSSETEMNAKLLQFVDHVADLVMEEYPDIEIHTAGAPKIAVGNSSQIKQDSVIAVSLAIVLILALLIYAFRSRKNMLLIVVSIAWGWIFAMGMLSVFRDSISIIVIGISSVILGIAVNYPLHLIDHLRHEPDIKEVLKDIVAPLVIGNITTVGAFMALIPLESTALRDLGLFASLLLIGTILFAIIYLPHLLKKPAAEKKIPENRFIRWMAGIKPEKSKTAVWLIIVLTIIFGWYSMDTEFDSNIANINYMDSRTKEDMAYFQSLLSIDTTSHTRTLYVVSSDTTFDLALEKSESLHNLFDTLSGYSYVTAYQGVGDFICSEREQQIRIERWNAFVETYADRLTKELSQKATACGFSPAAFEDFTTILNGQYSVKPYSYFRPLAKLIYSDNLSRDDASHRYSVVDKLQVDESTIDSLRHTIVGSFDVKSMNSAMADTLSDDFNYIGWACSFIVFFFLWFSFGNLELAALSFLPMAVSWLWILGIMTVTGIKFNIVNVILATFIFGQGDDYTIFITEGCCYEHAYRRPILSSYKRSIILSALIMFIGIGTLIVAKHPALRSLAEVTIIGMFSVVLMAYVLPPLVYGWIVSKHGKIRLRPLKVSSILRTLYGGAWWFTQLGLTYILAIMLRIFCRHRDLGQKILHKFNSAYYRLDLRMLPNIKIYYSNPAGEDFSKPAVIVANHQSMLDPMCLMAISDKILIIANKHSSHNPIVKPIFRWLDFYTLTDNFSKDMDVFRRKMEKGYSIAIFPEGIRNPNSNIERFHKGGFYMAHALNADIIPIVMHGVNGLMPIHSFACESGTITMSIEPRIKTSQLPWGDDSRETTKFVHKLFIDRYEEIRKSKEDCDYLAPLIRDRYLYKGIEIEKNVKRNLKRFSNYRKWIDSIDNTKPVVVINNGYGEFSLLLASVYPNLQITAYESDNLKRELAKFSAQDVVSNLTIKDFPVTEDLTECSTFMIPTSDKNNYGESVTLIE